MNTTPALSALAMSYPASTIRKIFEAAAGLEDVIQLTLGEPDFDTPEVVKDAAKHSLDRNETHYVSNAGLPALRQAIADRYRTGHPRSRAQIDNVMIAFGGMEALFLALSATVEPGGEVVVVEPGYPNYLGQIATLGANPVVVPLDPEQGFRVSAQRVLTAVTPRTRAILLNTPSNPLGAVIEADELAALVTQAAQRGIWVIVDEVYDALTYSGEAFPSAADHLGEGNVLVINSFSKTYAMTGWRIGYVLGPKAAIGVMPAFQEGIASCVPAFVQAGALAAIEQGSAFVAEAREAYRRRRALVVAELETIEGVRSVPSQGAFYAFLDVREHGLSSDEFCLRLLQEHGLALVPGTAFGQAGSGFVRLSYAASEQKITQGMARLRTFCSSLVEARRCSDG